MSLINTEAIILRITNYSDSRKMVTLFTQSKGKITAIGFGSNKLTSATNSIYQIGNLVSVSLNKNEETATIGTITNIESKNLFKATKSNLEKIMFAQYLLEYCDKNLEELDKNIQLYNKLLLFLNHIEYNNVTKNLISSWHLSAIRTLGFNPHIWSCRDCNKEITSGYWSTKDGGMCCGKETKEGKFIEPLELKVLKVLSAEVPLKSEIEIPQTIFQLILHFTKFNSYVPENSLKSLYIFLP